MAVSQRRAVASSGRGDDREAKQRNENTDSSTSTKKGAGGNSTCNLKGVMLSLVLLLIAAIRFPSWYSHHPWQLRHEVGRGAIGSVLQIRRRISEEATLVLYISQPLNSTSAATTTDVVAAAGTHTTNVVVDTSCRFPLFWMRLTGDALVAILLTESKTNFWSGTFEMPVEGAYRLDVRWYGCDPFDEKSHFGKQSTSWKPLSDPVSFHAIGNSTDLAAVKHDGSLFPPESIWLGTSSLTSLQGRGLDLPKYMWMNPKVDVLKGKFLKTSNSKVSTEGSLHPRTGYYDFKDLSNYELVCFMGSQTMADIRRAFLDIRSQNHPSQRPFKFHYYNISSFNKPDRDWGDEAKKKLRKCKHILVSLDESIDPVSQDMYRKQVTAFVGHLLKVVHDVTFPIWFFSVNEPPMRATNCYSPTMKRTTDHPCNDVLKDLFLVETNRFPDQIHFLDNTDLLMPQFDENRDDVLSVIALRIFVLVGKGVAAWRANDQKGAIDGLHRNGTIEPNYELIPYVGW